MNLPFGIGRQKPHHYRDMAKVAWANRAHPKYAYDVLTKGVCDGCALGVAGLHDWTIDGVQRDALVVRPRAAAVEHPLVIAFHGHGGTMQSTSLKMHIEALWPEAIVVYPRGLNTPTPHDPEGTNSGWQVDTGEGGDFGDRAHEPGQ